MFDGMVFSTGSVKRGGKKAQMADLHLGKRLVSSISVGPNTYLGDRQRQEEADAVLIAGMFDQAGPVSRRSAFG